jgi:hypothetical protein
LVHFGPATSIAWKQSNVFADFGSGMVRIGQLGVRGNATRDAKRLLPTKPKKVALNAYKEILER